MQGTLKIHSENILPIIKKWLYSEKDIFLRELVSNACDALQKLSILHDNKQVEKIPSLRVDVTIDKEKRTLTFSDNGIGMDQEEVEKYICQLAFSGAEEFVSKYQLQKEGEAIIGHFGLGFYSAYMVAENVEIETLSHKKESVAVHWVCDGSSSYSIEQGTRGEPGTDVILHISKGEEELLEPAKIRKLLTHYCSFLPYPIYLNGSVINEQAPLWMKPAAECTDKEYLDFYRFLFPTEQDPLFWVHLNVDFPFHLKGILYFPRITQERDFQKESIKLYCNRVFVSNNCNDILPNFLTILRGAIDSPDIPLNVSRSHLQMDATVKQLGSHISKKIADRLSALYRSEKEKFYDCWEDIELIIKYGALQDEKFYERVKEFLIWKNDRGEWTTVEEYLERNTERKVFYAPEDLASPHYLDLYKSKGIELLIVASSMIQQATFQMLESKLDVTFQRIDGALHDTLLDLSKEMSLLDAEGKTEGGRIAEFFRKKIDSEGLNVEAKSLASRSLPGFLLIKEEERRLRESLAFYGKEKGSFNVVKPTFVVNTNSPLVKAIYSVESKDPSLAKEMAIALYDHARISQKEMEPEALSIFLERNLQIWEKLAGKLV